MTTEPPTAAELPPEEGLAGEEYLALIADQLSDERGRKESFERRGFSIVTSGGVVITLLLTLATVITGVGGKPLPGATKVMFVAGVGLFLVAASCGIWANIPRPYNEADIEGLRNLMKPEYLKGRKSIGVLRVAELRVSILEHARDVNNKLARFVVAALILELIAVVLIGIGVATLVARG